MYFSEHRFFSPLYGCWPSSYTATDQMRDGGIIDTFLIFRVFKASRIFDKNDTWCLWGKIKPLTQYFAGGLNQVWSLKFMLVFVLHETFSGFDNMFETEAWYFWGNTKILLGHLDWSMSTKGPHSDPAD